VMLPGMMSPRSADAPARLTSAKISDCGALATGGGASANRQRKCAPAGAQVSGVEKK
jgi:hypothetical protein